MAFDRKDANAIITNGMFSGDWGSAIALSDSVKYLRILSHGLIDTAPSPTIIETVLNTMLKIGSSIMSFTNSFFRIG